MSNPLNKNKHKIQTKPTTKTAPPQTSAAKELKNSTVDELLSKLHSYNLTASDAATAAKYYYNQHDLQQLNPDQLANLYKRLVARAEAEASALVPDAPTSEPIQAALALAPTQPSEANTDEAPESASTSTTNSEEPNMSAIEQSSPIASKSLAPATEPLPFAEATPEVATPVVIEPPAEDAPLAVVSVVEPPPAEAVEAPVFVEEAASP